MEEAQYKFEKPSAESGNEKPDWIIPVRYLSVVIQSELERQPKNWTCNFVVVVYCKKYDNKSVIKARLFDLYDLFKLISFVFTYVFFSFRPILSKNGGVYCLIMFA